MPYLIIFLNDMVLLLQREEDMFNEFIGHDM
jgi:hypothetical protein